MNEKSTDLELISDGDLIDELRRRFEHMVFAGMKPGCSDGNRYTYAFEGNHMTVIGLAHWASMKSLEDLEAETEEWEEEEEEESPE